MFAFLIRKHFLEAVGQHLKLLRITKVSLQVAWAHLSIFKSTVRGSIQIILESLWWQRSLRHHLLGWAHKLISLTFHTLVHSDSIFKVVSSRAEVRILNDPAILGGTVLLQICRCETFSTITIETSLYQFLETWGRVVPISCWVQIFSINTRDEACVSRECLVAVVVGWAVEPCVCIFASISDLQIIVEGLRSCVDWFWSFGVAACLKVSYRLCDIFTTRLSLFKDLLSTAVTITDSAAYKFHLVGDVTSVPRNILATICHLFYLWRN